MISKNVCIMALAGLLHDIGKFADRGDFFVSPEFKRRHQGLYQPTKKGNFTHKHALYTAAFIEELESCFPKDFLQSQEIQEPLINLAASHHKPETPLQKIITVADRLSSGFDRNEFESPHKGIPYRDYKKTRMISLFEKLNFENPDRTEDGSPDAYNYKYQLQALSPKSIFPTKDASYSKQDYEILLESFIKALKSLRQRELNSICWLEDFEYILMVFASHIPSATVGKIIADVSLFDHSKMTAALSAALYLYHLEKGSLHDFDAIEVEDEKKFLLIHTDFYGIQQFIFSEGGATHRNLAKLLRGRSFAVSLMTELVADMLCRKIGIPSVSIILNAAGKSTIFAPNTEESRKAIVEVEEKVRHWMHEQFYGEVYIGISHIPVTPNDLLSKNLPALWDRLASQSELYKTIRVDFDAFGGVISGYLDSFRNDLSHPLCPLCGKRPSSIEDEKTMKGFSLCALCRDHIMFGSKLTKSSIVHISLSEKGDLKVPVFGVYQLQFYPEDDFSSIESVEKESRYWKFCLPKSNNPLPTDMVCKFLMGYIPRYSEEDESEESLNRFLYGTKSSKKKEELFDIIQEGAPRTFGHIANASLIPDKENPGKFYGKEFLGVLKADIDNLGLLFACGLPVKYQSLSKTATLSRQLNAFFSIHIPVALEGSNIYTLFAGGDDLFLIGPWNKIIEYSRDIRKRFQQYVCENENITLSAGISLHKANEPVSRFFTLSETALTEAKKEKNSISVFSEAVSWDVFDDFVFIHKKISNWVDSKIINTAMLFRLIEFSEMADKEERLLEGKGITIQEMQNLKWRALLHYSVMRNISQKMVEDEDARKEIITSCTRWIESYKSALKIVLYQILYNQRGG